MYKAVVNVSLKDSILDPQGQAALQALEKLGIKSAKEVRVGKQFVLTLDYKDKTEAEKSVKKICETILVNPVIEKYSFELTE